MFELSEKIKNEIIEEQIEYDKNLLEKLFFLSEKDEKEAEEFFADSDWQYIDLRKNGEDVTTLNSENAFMVIKNCNEEFISNRVEIRIDASDGAKLIFISGFVRKKFDKDGARYVKILHKGF